MSSPPLILAWGKERYQFRWSEDDLRQITLGQLKEVCREATGVPVSAMKLIFSGATMKDDSSPLIYYGVYPGSVMRLVGSKSGDSASQLSNEELEQQALIEKLDEIITETTDLALQKVRDFILNIQMYIDQFHGEESLNHDFEIKSIKQKERKILFDTYLYINEILMKRLLMADAIISPPGLDHIRTHRRKVVRQIQEWMNQIDEAKKRVLDLEESEKLELIEARISKNKM
ncbi:hypothetical protein BB559_005059 [Furculomyces boomerangus]|uniref:Uncharacterized protein n=3 Tax=Harpellales TaxID=61421 RepID=A0A2T9YB50_9FUNG|nr:hypothetical protein BB559_005059 [Furculomyces boomerangus]PWA00013.1 hypothetical protein BB558_003899 [Smittium angustum]